MPWRWNPSAFRYQNVNGSAYFLSHKQVLEWTSESIKSAISVSDSLSMMVQQQLLAPQDWYLIMREEIKREYIREYMLGIGGQYSMTPADWGSIGGMLKEQYGYLENFLNDIETMDLTEGQIMSRAAMYFNSAGEAYERAHGRVAEMWGAVEEAWNVNPALENCDDCLNFEDEGWQSIGYFPVPKQGETQCLTNCGCYITYMNEEGEEFGG